VEVGDVEDSHGGTDLSSRRISVARAAIIAAISHAQQVDRGTANRLR
jgi:hypothetical protein